MKNIQLSYESLGNFMDGYEDGFNAVDGRSKVRNTNKTPYLGVCRVSCKFKSKKQISYLQQLKNQPPYGSGGIMNCRMVYTAAHVIYDWSTEQFAQQIIVYPQNLPFNKKGIKVLRYQINQEYLNRQNKNRQQYDLAILILQSNQIIKKDQILEIEWNYSYEKYKAHKLLLCGYPIDKWQSEKKFNQYEEKKKPYKMNDPFLFYKHTTRKGNSGGPIILMNNQSQKNKSFKLNSEENKKAYKVIGMHKGMRGHLKYGLLFSNYSVIQLIMRSLNLQLSSLNSQLSVNSQKLKLREEQYHKSVKQNTRLELQNCQLEFQNKQLKEQQLRNDELIEKLNQKLKNYEQQILNLNNQKAKFSKSISYLKDNNITKENIIKEQKNKGNWPLLSNLIFGWNSNNKRESQIIQNENFEKQQKSNQNKYLTDVYKRKKEKEREVNEKWMIKNNNGYNSGTQTIRQIKDNILINYTCKVGFQTYQGYCNLDGRNLTKFMKDKILNNQYQCKTSFKQLQELLRSSLSKEKILVEIIDKNKNKRAVNKFNLNKKCQQILIQNNLLHYFVNNSLIETQNQLLIVQQYQKKSLEQHLQKGRKFSQLQIANIFLQLINCLNQLNQIGIIYQQYDITPSNIFLDHFHNVKLKFNLTTNDQFAQSKFKYNDKERLKFSEDRSLKDYYIAPEELNSQHYLLNLQNRQSKIYVWKWGLILYQMITGQFIFKGILTQHQMKNAHEKWFFKKQFNYPQYIPFHWKNILNNMLVLQPQKRCGLKRLEQLLKEARRQLKNEQFDHSNIEIQIQQFEKHNWQNLKYINLANSGITNQVWSQFVDNSILYKNLQVICIMNNAQLKRINQGDLQRFKKLKQISFATPQYSSSLSNQSKQILKRYALSHPAVILNY